MNIIKRSNYLWTPIKQAKTLRKITSPTTNIQAPLSHSVHTPSLYTQKKYVSDYFKLLYPHPETWQNLPSELLNLPKDIFQSIYRGSTFCVPKDLLTTKTTEALLEKNRNFWKVLPQKYKNKKNYFTAIQQGISLIELPQSSRSKALIFMAVSQNGLELKYVPKKDISKKLCEIAVKNSGISLEYVPKKYQDTQLYWTAIEQNGNALKFIKEENITKEMSLKSINNTPSCHIYVPDKFKDQNFYLELIKKNGKYIINVPDEFINLEMCLLAITQNPSYVQSIHPKHLPEFFLIKCILHNPEIIKWLPKHLITKKMYYIALQKNGNLIKVMPKEYQNEKTTHIALKKNPESLEFIEKKYLNKKIYLDCIKRNPNLLHIVPESEQSQEMYELAIEKNGRLLSYIPIQHRTYKRCLKAVIDTWYAIIYVPEEHKTKELCWIAMRQNLESTTYIPKQHKDTDFYMTCLEYDPNFIDEIPKSFKTKEFYNNAIKKKLIRWKKIPKEILNNTPLKPEVNALLCITDNPLSPASICLNQDILSQEITQNELVIPEKTYNDLFRIKKRTSLYQNADSLKLPLIDKNSTSYPPYESKQFGGRTLKEKKSYFKFWKEKEDLSDFLLESKTVTYINENNDFLKLLSSIPQSQIIGKILYTPEIAEKIKHFKDKPQLITDPKTDQTYYLIYHYTAPHEYSIFAHQPNLKAQHPYRDAHRGLLKGIHDVGRMASLGILYTNTLPTFHNSEEGREWILFGNMLKNTHAAGTMGDWCEKATDFPDYGYSGLRDYGDFELLGTIKTFLEKDKARINLISDWKTIQKASLYNAIGENILATLLLYARLHRHDTCYHHHNTATQNETQIFIENILDSFAKGYFQNKRISPHAIMNLKTNAYKSWLKITSERILYWTEKQDLNTPCYTKDLIKEKRLNPKIYPESPSLIKTPDNLDPKKGFINPKGSSNLGAKNATFPLINLTEGIALFCRGLEKIMNETN